MVEITWKDISFNFEPIMDNDSPQRYLIFLYSSWIEGYDLFILAEHVNESSVSKKDTMEVRNETFRKKSENHQEETEFVSETDNLRAFDTCRRLVLGIAVARMSHPSESFNVESKNRL